jgi:hypothetical protein
MMVTFKGVKGHEYRRILTGGDSVRGRRNGNTLVKGIKVGYICT